MKVIESILSGETNAKYHCEKLRGRIGSILIDADRSCLVLAPFRQFLKGELVAIQKEAEYTYAKILGPVEEVDAGVVPQWQVQSGPGQFETMNGSDLYAFDTTAAQARSSTCFSPLTSIDSAVASASPPPQSVDTLTSLQAVDSILSRWNFKLNMNYREALEENQRIRHRYDTEQQSHNHTRCELKACQEELERVRDRQICAICVEREINCVLIHCGRRRCP